jgi:ketosteroid isomerase-like protein
MSTGDIILAYLRAIETNQPDAASPFLHDDVLVIEHPNKISPNGARYDRAALRAAGERGAALMAQQRYDIRSMIIDGDRAAVQFAWTGTLRDGREMRAEIASIIELRDDKIWRQEQYDCYVA